MTTRDKFVDHKYILKQEGYAQYLNWDYELTGDLGKAKAFKSSESACEGAIAARRAGQKDLFTPCRLRIVAEIVPEPIEGYGDTVKGDDYPKHLDNLKFQELYPQKWEML